MKKLILATALCLGIAACGDGDGGDTTNADGSAAATGETGNTGEPATSTQTASTAFPSGARIVEEDGVTFRVDPDGTRVRLGPTESRIVVEDDVRFRVDPDGTRVRIDDEGAAIDVDLPDVDVGINEKGNPDVDVGDRDPDGGR